MATVTSKRRQRARAGRVSIVMIEVRVIHRQRSASEHEAILTIGLPPCDREAALGVGRRVRDEHALAR